MKYKLLAILMATLMCASPVLGFWHPPPPPGKPQPPCTYMGTLINGNLTWLFEEPADGFCEDFIVTVYVANVTDLYGYDFVLNYDSTYFNLKSWFVYPTWSPMAIIFNGTIAPGQYKQVATALPEAAGVDGDQKLADLTFHIMNDVCPPNTVSGSFDLRSFKLANSCSGIIEHTCNDVWATWKFKPVIPAMWIEPAEVNNSHVIPYPVEFTISVMLKDAVKMTDFTVELYWQQYYHDPAFDCLGYLWSTLLTTSSKKVVLNTEYFNDTTKNVFVAGPTCGSYNLTDILGDVLVHAHTNDGLVLNLTHPSKTIWLFNVTFAKCDPWYCGGQPHYTPSGEHDWILDVASTPIAFYPWTTISSLCGDITPTMTNGEYNYVPIPGDLDGSGHVDAIDLSILTDYYGATVSCNPADIPLGNPANGFTLYYDLNRDGSIDIYDIVIVAKNFCRRTP